MARKKPAVSPRKQPKQSRSKAMVDSILTATVRILNRSGLDRFNTHRVAEVAGVSIGSLYQYFPTKEALIAALIEKQMERQVRKIEERFQALGPESPEEAVEAIVSLCMKLFLSNRKYLKVLFEQAPVVGKFESILIARRYGRRLVQQTLEKFGDRIPSCDPSVASFVLTNALMGIIQTALFDYPDDIGPERLEEGVSRLLKGYLLPTKS